VTSLAVVRPVGKWLSAGTVRGLARTLSTILTQAVDDDLLTADPALRLGKYLRRADDRDPEIRPFTRDEVAQIVAVARHRFPEWYPWVLCGVRTGMRAGELLALP
jgi:integrase